MDIAGELERFVLAELADPDRKSLGREDDLVSEGIIDSLGILKLTTFIEEKFRFSISPDEIVPENFRDITSLTRFVEARVPRG